MTASEPSAPLASLSAGRAMTVDASAAPRVLHFVSGGFSGATQVASVLARAAHAAEPGSSLLVLRRKRSTDMARVLALGESGLPVIVVPGWSHLATIVALLRVCRQFRPDVLFAHGFSEHLWGRYAGLLAGVPALVQVEHNSRERYGRWRLAQAKWLAGRSARIVACSEGVQAALCERGLPAGLIEVIHNGIVLEPFAAAGDHLLAERLPGIVMAARFSAQKDHATLVRAVALLRQRGHCPPVLLAGLGSARHRRACQALVTALGLGDQVSLIGHCPNVPALLVSHPICALITHYEGMPLALVEGMAAGCAVVASAVPGVRELLRHGQDGWLVPAGDPAALAERLEAMLAVGPTVAGVAAAARQRALAEFGQVRMNERYAKLAIELKQAAGAHRIDP